MTSPDRKRARQSIVVTGLAAAFLIAAAGPGHADPNPPGPPTTAQSGALGGLLSDDGLVGGLLKGLTGGGPRD